ncbi:coproporphyrinogen III oxidase [Nitritalea halalkaliphila LW7]|uniref:Coproporphyrinogen III oxidase n=1 Tax=Nitritalea halalkaliphila LW7 TaxID=1189621 RepID=I5C458_9BACT|nr:radical SAM protein [Nitritalea halalkaliphila]EIM76610.1 coproporphyrinogen III oxidase [Nitritalea halalkaliphila LW7]
MSFGVQDVNPQVQQAINRIQPFEKVIEVTEAAREIGYTSINFDLIYGLPHQTPRSIRQTFTEVAALRPERIAFYSYAHLPAAFPAQKSFERFLPQNAEKRALYALGRELLTQLGYQEIGMDHFALPDDPLCQAKEQARLHRNFMGYTVKPSRLLLGLGSSAISDIHYAYVQNEKHVDSYRALLRLDRSAHVKGHVMSSEDIETRRLLLALTCNGRAEWNRCYFDGLSAEAKSQLEAFRSEGLLHFSNLGIRIRPEGMAYLRNICMVFDRRLQGDAQARKRYSQSI